jgi:excisionase family DNA binding protein
MKEYMDINELSQYLGVKKSTLYAKVARKQLPHYKINRLVRFKKDEIDRWMEELRQAPVDMNRKVMKLFKGLKHGNCDIGDLVKKSIETVKGQKV